MLATDTTVYEVGDSVFVSFDLKKGGVMYSNKGGCGYGPEYMATCQENEMYTHSGDPHCCYLLPEEYWIKKGSFHIIITYPGTYQVTIPFIKNTKRPPRPNSRKYKMAYSKVFKVKPKE